MVKLTIKYIRRYRSEKFFLCYFSCFKMSKLQRHECVNNPNVFLLHLWPLYKRKTKGMLIPFITKIYKAYFGIKLGDQDKFGLLALCVQHVLNKWSWCLLPFPWCRGNPRTMRMNATSAWWKWWDYLRRIRRRWFTPNLPSAIRPAPHDETLPVPDPPNNLGIWTWNMKILFQKITKKWTPKILFSNQLIPPLPSCFLKMNKWFGERSESSKKCCQSSWFKNKVHKSVGPRNNVRLVLSLWERSFAILWRERQHGVL